MIDFNKTDLENKLKQFPKEMQDKLLLLSYEDHFRNIVSYKNIKNEDVLYDVGYATMVTALGFASKQEMFEMILEAIGDEEETKHIFEEIDRTILVPNNLQGALDTTNQITPTQSPTTQLPQTPVPEIHETAEDILKEIENPTPAPSSLPVFTPTLVVNNANTIVPATLYPQQTPTPTPAPESIQTTPTTPTQVAPTQQQPSSNPTSIVMPTKESILDSKLKEPSVQPLQTTYYKIDPYREQTK